MIKEQVISYVTTNFRYYFFDAGVAKQANPNARQKNTKFRTLKKQRQTLMEDYDQRDIELEEYMRAIGTASIEYDRKMKDAAIDMQDELDISSSSSNSSSEKSDIGHASTVSFKPMTGDELRNHRKQQDKLIKEKGSIDYGISINDSDLSSNQQKILKPNPNIPDRNTLLSIDEGARQAKRTLKSWNFKVSASQPETPKGQLISKRHLMSSNLPKNQRNLYKDIL